MSDSQTSTTDALAEALDLFLDRLDSALALGEVVLEDVAERADLIRARKLKNLIRQHRKTLQAGETVRTEIAYRQAASAA